MSSTSIPIYRIEEYLPAGHGDNGCLRHAQAYDLGHARGIVRRWFGVGALQASRQWSGDGGGEGDDYAGYYPVEGWSEYPASHPRADGCGGAVIYRQRT